MKVVRAVPDRSKSPHEVVNAAKRVYIWSRAAELCTAFMAASLWGLSDGVLPDVEKRPRYMSCGLQHAC
jgi:hypothetical protein